VGAGTFFVGEEEDARTTRMKRVTRLVPPTRPERRGDVTRIAHVDRAEATRLAYASKCTPQCVGGGGGSSRFRAIGKT
jgi:hypothetical protein